MFVYAVNSPRAASSRPAANMPWLRSTYAIIYSYYIYLYIGLTRGIVKRETRLTIPSSIEAQLIVVRPVTLTPPFFAPYRFT